MALLYYIQKKIEVNYLILAEWDNVKFKRPVIPGDQLIMKSEITKIRGEFGRVHCEGYVDDQLVAQGDFTFALQKTEL